MTNLKQADYEASVEDRDETFVHGRAVEACGTVEQLPVKRKRYQRIYVEEE